MNWRAPWLKGRRWALITAGWEITSLVIVYKIVYEYMFNARAVASGSLTAIVAGWVVGSYILGRYTNITEEYQWSCRREIGEIGCISLMVAGIFAGHAWLIGADAVGPRVRGFVVVVLGITSCSALVGKAIARSQITDNEDVLIVAEEKEVEIVRREVMGEKVGRKNMITVNNIEGVIRILEERRNAQITVVISESLLINDSGEKLVYEIRSRGLKVMALVEWCESMLRRIPPELVTNTWLLRAEGFYMRPGSAVWRVKRFADVIGSTFLLVFTFPLVVATAIAIWVEDKGPIFYKQIRSGIYGNPIVIWKLRSMRVGSELGRPQWSMKEDKRITRVGKLIRRTRIDELPQLVSVLRGELSLVGPRPERPEIEEMLEREIPHYRVRHWIRPGLSGWAQVCYKYGASLEDSRNKLSYDIYYLRNGGPLLDIGIAIKTLRTVVMGGRGIKH